MEESLKGKSRVFLEKINLDLEEEKEVGMQCWCWMLRVMSERTLDIEVELCACFIDWQRTFYRFKWNKLLQLLTVTGVDWHQRKLISKLYMDQSLIVRPDQGETRNVEIGSGVRQCAVWHWFSSTYRANIIPRNTLEAFGDFSIGRQVIRRVKYADVLVLLDEEETVLQGMVDRLIEIGI